jgi:molybdopterin-containing oxidoreductase family iron-sulfur binding subunit
MEKCTYCTQRISRARIDANNQDRRIGDGEVVTACQAACPTEAIVFGDTNDHGSTVASAKRSVLNYALLEELQTVPRTTYLAHVRNPHPALAGDEAGGHA